MTAVPSEWVWLARIRRPQGRKGEVLCELLTDFPAKFAERKHLWLLPDDSQPSSRPTLSGAPSMPAHSGGMGGIATHTSRHPQEPRPVELTNHWLHKGAIVLHFAGIDSISQAEELAGLIVAIPRAERATLPEDEVHIADLIGCQLIDVAREPATTIGRLQNVDRSAGPVPLLIVQGAKGEILIPFAKAYLRKLDLESKRIEMALPEGLTDL
ncbi:MAG: ribosome maturation factor RimM [Acidobacteriota bacterium]